MRNVLKARSVRAIFFAFASTLVFAKSTLGEDHIIGVTTKQNGPIEIKIEYVKGDESVNSCQKEFAQEFAQNVERFFEVKNNFDRWNREAHSIGEIPPYIGPRNSYHHNKKNKFIQKFSMYESCDGVIKVRKDYKNLVKTFCEEMIIRYSKMKIDWSSTQASLRTLRSLKRELDKNKKLKKKGLRRLERIFGINYLFLFINTYEMELKATLKKEKQQLWLDSELQEQQKINDRANKRSHALEQARKNNFKKTTVRYSLNNYVHQHASRNISIKKLKTYHGNDVQHDIHGEIVDIVNRYSHHLHANGKWQHAVHVPNIDLFEATSVALELNNKLDSKTHEQTYSFLDFCHNLLVVKVGGTALHLMKKFGRGLEQAKTDMQNIISGDLKTFLHRIPKEHPALTLSPSDFFNKIKEQPLKETIGNAIQILSRGLGHTAMIISAVNVITPMLQAGAAAISGAASALAAKNILEPLAFELAPGGAVSVAAEGAASASVWQGVATSIGQAAHAFVKVAEQAGPLLAELQGGGGGGDNVNIEPIYDIKRLDPNKIHHILQNKHCWDKVVNDPKDWNQISKIISKVMKEGIEGPRKSDFVKALKINGHVVEVTYTKLANHTIRISNAWVKRN